MLRTVFFILMVGNMFLVLVIFTKMEQVKLSVTNYIYITIIIIE